MPTAGIAAGVPMAVAWDLLAGCNFGRLGGAQVAEPAAGCGAGVPLGLTRLRMKMVSSASFSLFCLQLTQLFLSL